MLDWYIGAVQDKDASLTGPFASREDAAAHFDATQRMFLIVRDNAHAPRGNANRFWQFHDFYRDDPRQDGYAGEVIVVNLDYSVLRNSHDGMTLYLGVMRETTRRPRHYRLFTSEEACNVAGYSPVSTRFRVRDNWTPDEELRDRAAGLRDGALRKLAETKVFNHVEGAFWHEQLQDLADKCLAAGLDELAAEIKSADEQIDRRTNWQ